jgi:hypothetical protein
MWVGPSGCSIVMRCHLIIIMKVQCKSARIKNCCTLYNHEGFTNVSQFYLLVHASSSTISQLAEPSPELPVPYFGLSPKWRHVFRQEFCSILDQTHHPSRFSAFDRSSIAFAIFCRENVRTAEREARRARLHRYIEIQETRNRTLVSTQAPGFDDLSGIIGSLKYDMRA